MNKLLLDLRQRLNLWIPTNERLPNKGGTYIVTTWCDSIQSHITDLDIFVASKTPYWVNADNNKDVIAWKRLPKEYKQRQRSYMYP